MAEPREKQIEDIIEDYGDAMINFAYTYVKNWSTAEDVVQDALIKVYDRLHTFGRSSSIKTWLFAIVANQCKDYLRKNFVKKIIVGGVREADLAVPDSSPEQYLDAQASEKELAERILSLPIKYREVIVLHYYEDLSVSEISEFLGANLSTVKSRLQRARKKLRSALEEVWDYA
ncbi:MAG TPA: sigma-70 family RNA polymerase sigma factor [Bacillales bacterium]|nr:sigma-70 family RNA polymerase sigma factor [Bacillales bacterium]